MTTVAYRFGVLASDGRISEDNFILSNSFKKIHKIKKNLYGFCGPVVEWEKFLRWDEKKNKDLEFDVGFDAIMVTPEGEITNFVVGEDKKLHRIELGVREYFAIGSGRELALGAMAGNSELSASSAIKIAAKFDTCTGGTIFTEKF